MRFYLISLLSYAFLLAVPTATALPSSARLFQMHYGYKTSCMLCHANGGGSRPNDYGKAFLRAGANLSAFKKIENKDSDEDGTTNLKEILAKSNPGKKQSTPTQPGDWLAHVGGVYIPIDELKELFSESYKFSALEGSLSIEQIQKLKAKLAQDLKDDDKVPTFYFAEKDGKKVAVVQFVTSKGASSSLTAAIAVSVDAKLVSTQILKLTKGLSDPSVFAKGMENKNFSQLAMLTTKLESEKLLLDATRRSLALLSIVFGGSK
ncbi:MAG: hypothetical protein R3A80_11080 [Bdellovibrionota bacterium]